MKKTEKSKYGKMLLEIFRCIKYRIKSVDKSISMIAETNSLYMYGGTLGQMEKIISLTEAKDRLERLEFRLKKACKVIMSRYKDLFIATVHPDVEVRERLTKEIKDGFKYRIYFNRYFDKMTADLYDVFFDEEWTIEFFFEYFKEEPSIRRALAIAEHFYEKRGRKIEDECNRLSRE